MKRLIKTVYAKSKKLDRSLFKFLKTCINTFTYNTNAALLNECMTYINNIDIKKVTKENEAEMYMYYMKIKTYAMNNNLMNEFESLQDQPQIDKKLTSAGYTTTVATNDGTKVSGDQIICIYKNDKLGDTYYVYKTNDKFILKSSNDLNADLLTTDDTDSGFDEIEKLVIERINDVPGYVRNTVSLPEINFGTEAWQEYLNSTAGEGNEEQTDSNESTSTSTITETVQKNTKQDEEKTEYTVDIKFDSKDIAAINSFVSSTERNKSVVKTTFEQIKSASLKYRLVKQAFAANNIMSGFKAYFSNMNFISAYFKDENKSDCCGLIAEVDGDFIALSYGCDNDLSQFELTFNDICSANFSDIIDANEKIVITAYYNENNKTSELLKQYDEYEKDNDAFVKNKTEVDGMSMDDVAKLIETMEELSSQESQNINYLSPEYKTAVLNIFLNNAFYAEECTTFKDAEDYIFANNAVHSYTFYNNSYSPAAGRNELKQSPKYYLHVTFYKNYKYTFQTWLENHEKIILNYTDVEAQMKIVPDSNERK